MAAARFGLATALRRYHEPLRWVSLVSRYARSQDDVDQRYSLPSLNTTSPALGRLFAPRV
jgi:hypothetical protein